MENGRLKKRYRSVLPCIYIHIYIITKPRFVWSSIAIFKYQRVVHVDRYIVWRKSGILALAMALHQILIDCDRHAKHIRHKCILISSSLKKIQNIWHHTFQLVLPQFPLFAPCSSKHDELNDLSTQPPHSQGRSQLSWHWSLGSSGHIWSNPTLASSAGSRGARRYGKLHPSPGICWFSMVDWSSTHRLIHVIHVFQGQFQSWRWTRTSRPDVWIFEIQPGRSGGSWRGTVLRGCLLKGIAAMYKNIWTIEISYNINILCKYISMHVRTYVWVGMYVGIYIYMYLSGHAFGLSDPILLQHVGHTAGQLHHVLAPCWRHSGAPSSIGESATTSTCPPGGPWITSLGFTIDGKWWKMVTLPT